jgi:hypothetical protein
MISPTRYAAQYQQKGPTMRLVVDEVCMGDGSHPVESFQQAHEKMQELFKRDFPDHAEMSMPPLDYLQGYYCCMDLDSDRGCACAAMRQALTLRHEENRRT